MQNRLKTRIAQVPDADEAIRLFEKGLGAVLSVSKEDFQREEQRYKQSAADRSKRSPKPKTGT